MDIAGSLPTRLPRVLIIEKGGGVLSWGEDLERAFGELGAVASRQRWRVADPIEKFSRWRTQARGLQNPHTVRRIASAAGKFQPDLIVLLNLHALPEAAEQAIRAATSPQVPIVGWLCDRPSCTPNGYEPVLNGVYYFDSACLELLQPLYQNTGTKLEFLELAVCPQRCSGSAEIPLGSDRRLAFAGYESASRKCVFDALRRSGAELVIYGPGTCAGRWRLGRRRLGACELARIYRHHLINLNLPQRENTVNGLNLRAFEIPCAGGLGSYPQVPDLERSFVPDKEIVSYGSIEELRSKSDELGREPERAYEMARAGHFRVLRDHTFLRRAERMLTDWTGPLRDFSRAVAISSDP